VVTELARNERRGVYVGADVDDATPDIWIIREAVLRMKLNSKRG
jgi:hypothetical protein